MGDHDEDPPTSLDAAVRALGRDAARSGTQVTGTFDDQPILYREHPGTSIIIAPLPARVRDLILHVFPASEFARRQVDGGQQVDVVVGDAPFDDQFIVEAAPSDVVTALLDEPLRGWLRTHGAQRFQLIEDREDTEVRVELPRLAAAAVAEGIEQVARFAAGLDTRVARLAERLELAAPRAGAPFRPEIDDAAIAEVRRIRAQELAQLRAAIATPDGAGYVLVLGVITAVLGFLGLIVS